MSDVIIRYRHPFQFIFKFDVFLSVFDIWWYLVPYLLFWAQHIYDMLMNFVIVLFTCFNPRYEIVFTLLSSCMI